MPMRCLFASLPSSTHEKTLRQKSMTRTDAEMAGLRYVFVDVVLSIADIRA